MNVLVSRNRPAVVTGASSGIGYETARALASRGYDLVIVARASKKLDDAAARLHRETGAAVEAIPCDLAEQAEVRVLADRLDAEHDGLSVLVNNAGIFPGRRTETGDGIERCLAVNYLAPYLLTRLLLPALASGDGGGRVVNVSSSAQARGRIKLDDLSLERGYGRLRAYDQSKLALIVFTAELARRIDPAVVSATAVDPGWVRTAQTRQFGPYLLFNLLGRPVQVSPARGSESSVRAATAPDLATQSGGFLGPTGAAAHPNPAVRDRQLARRLWEISEELVGLAPYSRGTGRMSTTLPETNPTTKKGSVA
jgi:NAD(P)-dependent dehydrogenase (short-subunit alcohol dehydrogenase family)